MRYTVCVTLDKYLNDTGESDEEFGSRCRPKIHRTKVYLYRTRKASPRAEKVAAIEKASGYRVRAADLTRLSNGHTRRPSHAQSTVPNT